MSSGRIARSTDAAIPQKSSNQGFLFLQVSEKGKYMQLRSRYGASGGMKKAKTLYINILALCLGGADGTRTRDPRRDRPLF